MPSLGFPLGGPLGADDQDSGTAAAVAGAPIRDFLMDDNGDLAIVAGDFAVVAGAAAVDQGIKIRLSFFLAECYLDESVGVPYREQILIKNPDPVVVRELLRSTIADTPDVTDVVGAALQLDAGDRHAAVSYIVNTVYSENPVTGEAVV